jgi:hypothetical protein
MGMKAKAEMPPPIDKSVTERTEQKEAALEAERQRMIKAGSLGRNYSIMTSGEGVTGTAETGKTLLGGTK